MSVRYKVQEDDLSMLSLTSSATIETQLSGNGSERADEDGAEDSSAGDHLTSQEKYPHVTVTVGDGSSCSLFLCFQQENKFKKGACVAVIIGVVLLIIAALVIAFKKAAATPVTPAITPAGADDNNNVTTSYPNPDVSTPSPPDGLSTLYSARSVICSATFEYTYSGIKMPNEVYTDVTTVFADNEVVDLDRGVAVHCHKKCDGETVHECINAEYMVATKSTEDGQTDGECAMTMIETMRSGFHLNFGNEGGFFVVYNPNDMKCVDDDHSRLFRKLLEIYHASNESMLSVESGDYCQFSGDSSYCMFISSLDEAERAWSREYEQEELRVSVGLAFHGVHFDFDIGLVNAVQIQQEDFLDGNIPQVLVLIVEVSNIESHGDDALNKNAHREAITEAVEMTYG